MKSIILPAVLLTLLTGVSLGQEQEQSYGIFNDQKEYHQFMGGIKRAAVGNPEMMAMIPLVNDIALQQEIGATARKYNSVGSELGLLSNRAIREDIEMVDDQYEELKQLNSQVQKRMGEQLRSIDFSDVESALSQIRKMRDDAQADLNAVLLPHQVSRLQQIRMQTLLRKRSLVQILTSDPFKSDLEITDVQTDRLKNAEQRINEKLAEKIADLREQAREELIAELDPAQRTRVNDMIGDAFDLKQLSAKPADKKKPGDGKSKFSKKGYKKSN